MTLLIKKPIKSGDIVTIKLETSEELIAKVESDTGDVLQLSKPMTLSYGAQGVGMTPWLITANQESQIELPKSRIITMTLTMKNAADQYIQGTTGIKTVSSL